MYKNITIGIDRVFEASLYLRNAIIYYRLGNDGTLLSEKLPNYQNAHAAVTSSLKYFQESSNAKLLLGILEGKMGNNKRGLELL